MSLQFHMTPGSCTTGIHILLEELEQPFKVSIVNLAETGCAMGSDVGPFYALFWASKTQIAQPPRSQALFERIRARPVVQRVLREESYR